VRPLISAVREQTPSNPVLRTRCGVLHAYDCTGHITDNQLLQLMQHANRSVRRKNYMPDYFGGDAGAAWKNAEP
jgi:hypothetical protein